MMYLNEIDPYAAAWLRNLYPEATVDERSICDLEPGDIPAGHAHFFAGIGGWPYALALAGWPDDEEVWTGSCPCQPFSTSGRRSGSRDERHLWPAFFRLIAECKPSVVFGEQVGGAHGYQWLARVRADLEGAGYAVGAADLCAAGVGETAYVEIIDEFTGAVVYQGGGVVGPPHIRQRLFWVAESEGARGRANAGTVRGGSAKGLRDPQGQDERRAVEQTGRAGDSGTTRGLADAGIERRQQKRCGTSRDEGTDGRQQNGHHVASGSGEADRLGDALGAGLEERPGVGRDDGTERAAPERAGGAAGGLGEADEQRREGFGLHVRAGEPRQYRVETAGAGQDRMADPATETRRYGPRREGAPRRADSELGRREVDRRDAWADAEWLPCLDGKARRTQSGLRVLVDGLPFVLADGRTSVAQRVKRAPLLKALGNAIVPQVAAEFVRAFMEATPPGETQTRRAPGGPR